MRRFCRTGRIFAIAAGPAISTTSNSATASVRNTRLKADAGCRNTVFNSRAQASAEFVEKLLALGVKKFRVEFLNESAEEVERIISPNTARTFLRGEISAHTNSGGS